MCSSRVHFPGCGSETKQGRLMFKEFKEAALWLVKPVTSTKEKLAKHIGSIEAWITMGLLTVWSATIISSIVSGEWSTMMAWLCTCMYFTLWMMSSASVKRHRNLLQRSYLQTSRALEHMQAEIERLKIQQATARPDEPVQQEERRDNSLPDPANILSEF